MNITVIGLGLIGGSLCRAIKKHTAEHKVFGTDLNSDVVAAALRQGVIDGSGSAGELLQNSDLSIICLYPDRTIDFIKANLGSLKKGSLVIDVGGVKSSVVYAVSEDVRRAGAEFIGCHPMAGREFSGFDYSTDSLFDGASFIITPTAESSEEGVALLGEFALSVGFGKAVISTPEEHDRIIAYTSQLAHIVSSAYVKSPSLALQPGFSAGSFQDLTRVAKLNEDMWTTLFLMNREPLLDEVETVIRHLEEYRRALAESDDNYLRELLRDGRIKKEWSLESK